MNEKQQVVHIGGGEAFNSYDQYITYLKTAPLYHMEPEYTPTWSKRYDEYLEEETYQCLKLPMPSSGNAKYEEWKIWFERHFPYFQDNIILVGHSLGGVFLAKYLSEHTFPFTIQQLHLVAAPFDSENDIEQLADFKIIEFPKSFFDNTIGKIHIYHSKDDTVVPISESEKYHQQLPGSHLHVFEDRFHFLDETFPELFTNIKKTDH